MYFSSERISEKPLELNSCGIQQLGDRDRTMLRRDGRVDYHLLYIMKGACYLTEAEGEIAVPAENLVLYLPGERQEYAFRAVDDTVSGYIHFSGTEVPEVFARLGLSGRVIAVGESGEAERVFREMASEYQLKKPFWEDACAALLLRFLALAGRLSRDLEAGVAPALRHRMDDVCRAMHREAAENRSVGDYARMCHLSEGRFTHAFKESTGLSPKQYMMRIKVDVACQLLAGTGLSVAEVAAAVGIEDVSYFSRLIKKYTGRSPSAQR